MLLAVSNIISETGFYFLRDEFLGERQLVVGEIQKLKHSGLLKFRIQSPDVSGNNFIFNGHLCVAIRILRMAIMQPLGKSESHT